MPNEAVNERNINAIAERMKVLEGELFEMKAQYGQVLTALSTAQTSEQRLSEQVTALMVWRATLANRWEV